MAKTLLDRTFLKKIAAKMKKEPNYINVLVSQKADKLSISPKAALALIAKDHKIGTTVYLKKLDTSVREEVRNALSSGLAQVSQTHSVTKIEKRGKFKENPRQILGKSIEHLIQDQELKDRCKDLLSANKHFDRVFREATTVFDDRLKRMTGITNMNPTDLVGKVLNPDPLKAIIVVSQSVNEQMGFFSLCKGIMLLFRNNAHHNLTNNFTQEDAIKFCGFIDTILSILKNGSVHKDRV